MFGLLWKILPKNYKFSIAFKNVGIMAGKAVVGLLAGSVLAEKLSPEHVQAIGAVVTVATTMALEGLHDWAAVKWPNATWL